MSITTAVKRDFFELVKAIGESKSKQEEDRIVYDEVQYLKKCMTQPIKDKKKMKELVLRLIYVEMLGQDASFAYIKAVELCASTSIGQKKAGYLAASLCLSPDHEFRFMLVNQIQRDMNSSNFLEICTALTAVNKIVTMDMIPAVIGDVIKLLKHEMESVRKKAIAAMHRIYQMDKSSLIDHIPKIRAALCDKDPSVMAATLPLFQAMIVDDPMQFKDLVPSFVSILKQVTDHRLPRDYDYHRIPSPWIQMNLLRILSLLGRGDKVSSEGMYEVLVDVMKRADTGINIGYAIVYEVVKTITSIYPNVMLLDAAATSISRFIRSESHNLKYIGVKGLAAIVKDHPKYAVDHQMAVIDCLEDKDETLKRKTLDLLFRMTNAINVEFIVEKLLSFLATATDDHFRTDLVGQITQCAERFAPSNAWYIQTIIQVFELAGDKVKASVAHTLTQLIAEGDSTEDDGDDDGDNESENRDNELRTNAVENFLDLMEKPKLPEILAQAISWVLGEYGYLSTSCSKEQIMIKLSELSLKSNDSITKSQIITSIMKLVAQNGSCPSKINVYVTTHMKSISLEIQQRCFEFNGLLRHPNTMVEVLPVDGSCEDIEVDSKLSFLNSYVQSALNLGAKPYSPPNYQDDDEDDDHSGGPTLKVTPYATPIIPQIAVNSLNALSSSTSINGTTSLTLSGMNNMNNMILGANQQTLTAQSIATTQGNQLINRGVTQVWGKPVIIPVVPPSSPISTTTSNTSSNNSIGMNNTNTTTGNAGNNNISASYTQQQQFQNNSPLPAQQYQQQQQQVSSPVVISKELSEKQKQAAALFGGIAGTNSANKRRTSGRTESSANNPVVVNLIEPSLSPSTQQVQVANSLIDTVPAIPIVTTSNIELFDTNDLTYHNTTTNNNNNISYTNNNTTSSVDILSMESIQHSNTTTNNTTTTNTTTNTMFAPYKQGMIPQNTTNHQHSQLPPPILTLPPTNTTTIAITPTNNITSAFEDLLLSPTTTANLSNSNSIQVPIPDKNIAPLVIVTAEYGKRWGTMPFDSKQSITCINNGLISLEQLRQAMPISYHHVESITATQEAIFSAMITSTGSIILVHIKLHSQRKTCDILVKSNNKELCKQEINYIATSLLAWK